MLGKKQFCNSKSDSPTHTHTHTYTHTHIHTPAEQPSNVLPSMVTVALSAFTPPPDCKEEKEEREEGVGEGRGQMMGT